MRSTATSWLVRGCPVQFIEMWLNRRCSIRFHCASRRLEVDRVE
jgi:hypothetical protein